MIALRRWQIEPLAQRLSSRSKLAFEAQTPAEVRALYKESSTGVASDIGLLLKGLKNEILPVRVIKEESFRENSPYTPL